MKKIIAALDGLKPSESTKQYAIELARINNAFLTGVFLDDFSYTSYNIYDVVTKDGANERDLEQFNREDSARRDRAGNVFGQACREAGIAYNIHHDNNIALQELVHESTYADLLVIDSSETFQQRPDKIPTRFIRDLLPDVHCPVLVVPQEFRPIEKLVFLYDGTPSSVYAIKMVSYLMHFPENIPAEVVSVKGFYEDLHLPDNRLMKEFMKRHFPQSSFVVLKGNAETGMTDYLKNQKQPMMVAMGAYGRSNISRWLKQSMGNVLMKELNTCIFIAHH